MVFGFGSSSSSKSTDAAPAPDAGAAPSRQQRKVCWDNRDAYFACLDSNGITAADDGDLGDAKGVCADFRKTYETSCSKSWTDYFNKRRILEFRQAATLAEAARQREAAAKR